MADRATAHAPSRERRSRDEAELQRRNGHREADDHRAPRRSAHPQSDGMKAARVAAENVLALTGRCPERVISVAREDDCWQVGVEVLELRRIPDTTDILAVYEVTLDSNGDLVRCERGQRYHRGQVQDEL